MANLVGITEDAGVAGVFGQSTNQTDEAGVGVHGASRGTGVVGVSSTWHGVVGSSQSSTGGHGVLGEAIGTGVAGVSKTWMGVYGETHGSAGAGVFGEGKHNGDGVKGHASGQGKAAVAGFHLTNKGPGIYGKGATGGIFEGSQTGISATGGADDRNLAGFFNGNVEVTGDIRLPNADCAEEFDVADAAAIEPGTVMVLDGEGALVESCAPYDKRVAGVVSGAGDYRPGIVLDKQETRQNRKPIALLGKVFCKVDASNGAIEVGDLLTTSDSPGRAMKAQDPSRAFGAVIGKALCSLKDGQGLIPVLIALQ